MKVRTIDKAVAEICNRSLPVHNKQKQKNKRRRYEYELKMLWWHDSFGKTHPAVAQKFKGEFHV